MVPMLQPDELLRVRLVKRQLNRSKLDPPEILVHFLEPDRLANQGFTQEQPTALPFDLSIGAHPAHLIAARVLDLWEPPRERSRRGRVAVRRGLHGQGFMGTVVIVFLSKLHEGLLLPTPGPARRLGRGLLEGPVQAFMPPILLGVPGLNPFRPDPQPNPPHRQLRQPPPSPTEANGGPLSLRIACGSPYSRNAATKTGCTSAYVAPRRLWHRSKYRLARSESVNGSIRVPSWVRNHPLKSVAHTAFGSRAACKGCVAAGVRRRMRRLATSPWRFRISPAVLGAGHAVPGSSVASRWSSLRGPQCGCCTRSCTRRSWSGTGVRCGRVCGARWCSCIPAQPSASYRAIHL